MKKYTRSKIYVLKTIPPEGEGLRTREMEIKQELSKEALALPKKTDCLQLDFWGDAI